MPGRCFSVCALAVLMFGAMAGAAPERKVVQKRGITIIVPDDKPTIQAAMDAAKAGDTIRVQPGVYREGIVFKNGVRLIGADQKTCRIEPPDNAAATLVAIDCKEGSIENLTFDGDDREFKKIFSLGFTTEERGGKVYVKAVEEGSPAARQGMRLGMRVISIEGRSAAAAADWVPYLSGASGKARTLRLGLQHKDEPIKEYLLFATAMRASGTWPDALALLNSSVQVRRCVVKRHVGTGLVVKGSKCTPLVTQSVFAENHGAGMLLGHHTQGVVEQNVCEMNGEAGIGVVGKDARPLLKGNRCNRNVAGIVFGLGARGRAIGNTCDGNETQGILVYGKGAAPLLRANQCNGNKLAGIAFIAQAMGAADRNVCNGNGVSGILMMQSGTAPVLRANECVGNGQMGLCFGMGAGGTAEKNICDKNGRFGIAVFDQDTAPTLRENRCDNNGAWGIFFTADARPVIANDNTATGNEQGQIISPEAYEQPEKGGAPPVRE